MFVLAALSVAGTYFILPDGTLWKHPNGLLAVRTRRHMPEPALLCLTNQTPLQNARASITQATPCPARITRGTGGQRARLKVPSFRPLISVDYLCLLTLNMFTFCKTRLLMWTLSWDFCNCNCDAMRCEPRRGSSRETLHSRRIPCSGYCSLSLSTACQSLAGHSNFNSSKRSPRDEMASIWRRSSAILMTLTWLKRGCQKGAGPGSGMR